MSRNASAACAIALMIVVGVIGFAGRGRADRQVVPSPKDFAEFLAARDLVFVGTAQEIHELRRKRLETCGTTGLSAFPETDVTVRVSSVWLGTVEDSVLQVSVIGQGLFSEGLLQPGRSVLVWASRDCDDGWRLWGNLCVVMPDGRVIGRDSELEDVRLQGQPNGSPLLLTALQSAMTIPAAAHPSRAFEGRPAIALGRLVRTSARSPSGFVYECDSLGWVIGTGAAVPRFIEYPLLTDCYPDIFPGDTLLIPVPSAFTGNRLSLSACPRALKVQRGFVPGLGVPLGFIRYALRQDIGGLHVKPFVTREP